MTGIIPSILIAIGLPGAGKTTALKWLALTGGFVYCGLDEIRLELTGDEVDQSVNRRAWEIARERIMHHARMDESMILDATGVDPAQRRELLLYCKRWYGQIEGAYFQVPYDICLQRNQDRARQVPEWAMERMNAQLLAHPPRLSEGFARLHYFNEFGQLVKSESRQSVAAS